MKDTREITEISPADAGHPGSFYGSPYYLLHNGKPLPLCIEENDPTAITWRDEWATIATPEAVDYCCFDGNNWRAYNDARKPNSL